MLSPNGKPCEAARNPINFFYGKTSTCEGENTLNKVGNAKHILFQWYAYQMVWKPMRRFTMVIPLLARA